ncbi:pentapeptide repeat-containing protein [Streptomyces sp. CA-106131]|uniref:pentapeptide repeat-containing protein n=1 Tax=Streptomyces sp. CA-106131 TaxID=3240045 RepID=UPI003D8BCC19
MSAEGARRARWRVWWRRWRRVAWGGIVVVGVLGAVLLVLGPVSWLVAGDTVSSLRGKERADAVNAVRQTVLATVTGATVFVGLFYTARTYLLSRRGQVTERFRTAIQHLASDTMELRLGGVYGLEHVLSESPHEHAAVVSVLAAFVRHSTRPDPAPAADLTLPETRNAGRPSLPQGTQPSPDVQAAVDVLARRPERHEPRRIDLGDAALCGLFLRGFEFDGAPRLDRVFLTHADLRSADLRGSRLQGAVLNFADLRQAALHGARLDGALLHRADLRGAGVSGAVLKGADLTGADLRNCDGLTEEQLADARIDDSTRLPPALAELAARRAQDDGSPTPPQPTGGTR